MDYMKVRALAFSIHLPSAVDAFSRAIVISLFTFEALVGVYSLMPLYI